LQRDQPQTSRVKTVLVVLGSTGRYFYWVFLYPILILLGHLDASGATVASRQLAGQSEKR